MAGQLLLDVTQNMLTSLGTSVASATREDSREWWREDSAWREEDISWRGEESTARTAEREKRRERRGWQEQDFQQMDLENARNLWLRFVEKNRREVEEKTEQLKAISNISALFALCAVVNLTQLNIKTDADPAPPLGVIALYGLLTALVECLMTISMVTCALILGCILKVGKLFVNEESEEEFMAACHRFRLDFKVGDRPPHPRKSFEAFWASRCESSWLLAFNCCCWGVTASLVSMIAIGWVVFISTPTPRISFTILTVLGVCLWSLVQWSWGSYWRGGRPAIGPSSSASAVKSSSSMPSFNHLVPPGTQPAGGFAGLPFDWHTAPSAAIAPLPPPRPPTPPPPSLADPPPPRSPLPS